MQVVHIDLGVAFEQGRFLNTPELVPFRLTRDVVDGMGATGYTQLTTHAHLLYRITAHFRDSVAATVYGSLWSPVTDGSHTCL